MSLADKSLRQIQIIDGYKIVYSVSYDDENAMLFPQIKQEIRHTVTFGNQLWTERKTALDYKQKGMNTIYILKRNEANA